MHSNAPTFDKYKPLIGTPKFKNSYKKVLFKPDC